MDYCNLDSEVADTLNVLRPPVLRGFQGDCSVDYLESPNLLRDFRTKVSKRIRVPVGEVSPLFSTEVLSSSSVIYKETSGEKILKKYSTLSYTNFQHSRKTIQHAQSNSAKDKPLIQITVIPKQSDKNLKSNPKIRKRIDTKPPHITVSNHKSCIKSSNIFLVVSGRKKERVYEVKATSSAEVTSQSYIKNERIPVDEVKNFKQLIESLNMDKKKKKAKGQKDDAKSKKGAVKNADEERAREGSLAERHFMVGGDECSAYCSYPCASKYTSRDNQDLKDRKSRVRITGRIGLTEDDQYVLRCAATVDDKPVISNIAQIPLPPEMLNKDFKLNKNDVRPHDNSRERGMKDSNVQADFYMETSYDTAQSNKPPRQEAQFDSSDKYNTVTLSNIETLKIVSNKNAQIQFNGPGEISNMGQHSGSYDKYNGPQYPNCCSHPLVIISVYPKQELAEKTKAEKGKESGPKLPLKMNVFSASVKTRPSAKPKSEKESRSPRSTRSPSPARSSSPSPIPSPTRKQAKVKNSIIQTDSKTGKTKKKESAAQTQNKNKAPQIRESIKDNKNSPRRFVSQTRTDGKKPPTTNSLSKAKNQETSNDVQLTKKALVDTYTKKLTEQIDWNTNRRHPAKNEVSNVTINIDGEHEFYDLMFHQGNQTTDLRVRRSVKEQGSQMHDYDSPSLENFLLSENHPDPATRKRSFSQTFYEPSNDDLGLQKPLESRLNLRDSIEICHRREKSYASACPLLGSEDVHKASKILSHENIANSGPELLDLPVKHFQGDNCSILDPVQRDQEIRQLLGVQRSRTKQNPAKVKYEIYNSEQSCDWCKSYCLLREIGDSIDSYYNLSTSNSFEEQMNHIFNTSAGCADAQCQTSEVKHCNAPKCHDSGCPQIDTRCSILFNSNKITKLENENTKQKKIKPPQLVQELRHLNFSKSKKSDGCLPPQCPSTFQQIVLNRSINVYLEIKKFSKQKPIVLSRKQYDKVKKAIGNRYCNKKNQMPKARDDNRESCPPSSFKSGNCEEIQLDDSDNEQDCKNLYENCEKDIQVDACDNERVCNKPYCDCSSGDNDNIQCCNRSLALSRNYREEPEKSLRTCYYCGRPQSKTHKYCYFCGMYQSVDETERMFYYTAENLPSRSSRLLNLYPIGRPTEIRYTSFAFVEFSSTNAEVQTPVPPPPSISSLSNETKHVERSDSILTIFKGGRRRSITPNLGTSIYSLATEFSEDLVPSLEEQKPQKPFFRRLMSCLVLRSARVSPLKLSRPIPKTLQRSSVDSYHISTSLGAIELGSSLYDTSASFYSDHMIPITSKNRKGGFLSSIRGFLTSKKSSRHQRDT